MPAKDTPEDTKKKTKPKTMTAEQYERWLDENGALLKDPH